MGEASSASPALAISASEGSAQRIARATSTSSASTIAIQRTFSSAPDSPVRTTAASIAWLVLKAVPLTPPPLRPPWNQYSTEAWKSAMNPITAATANVLPAVIAER